MNALLHEMDVLVLPSYYREGVPRILLEGLSKGLPILTTNSVGCKETVEEGINGYKIRFEILLLCKMRCANLLICLLPIVWPWVLE
ncbi:MAG: glycosyltransferase [Bacteroidetes bacterium]|nr:glycosyltransferase [Bacteroidota bacterium]